MKIIFCKGQFLGPISGADETLVTYACQLQRLGYAVSVLLMYPHSPDDQYYVRLREAGVPVRTVASGSVSRTFRVGRRLSRGLLRTLPASQHFVRERAQRIATSVASRYFERCLHLLQQSGADIIHVMTPDPSAMVMIRAAHAAGIPVIYQELGKPFHPPKFEAYYEQFTAVLPLCAAVTALSPRLAQECREKLPGAKKLSVLPITTEDLRNGQSMRRDSSAELTFGFAARIERLKGPLVLLEAFAAASSYCKGLRLKIAGSGSMKKEVTARARVRGVASRCEFVGVYTDALNRKSFMEHLDFFVLPSLTEGTPNSIIEAMSHRLPIIASAVGGIPDVVTPDVGILVPPNDPPALAQAILKLAEDAKLRERMGRAARRRYELLFSPTVVMPALLETYRRVTAVAPPRATLPVGRDPHPWEGPDQSISLDALAHGDFHARR